MAQPTSIFTSPSTTVVQVDSLQSPYTPVILNAVSFPGQVVTVLNTLSSLNILSNPIVVSTFTNTSFTNGTTSTLIEQPLGFLTAQTILPNQWTTLNSYPFRDQAISAGVQLLNTSTLFTAVISTLYDMTSSMKVENLVVSGNFFQSSGLILNNSVSTLGAVILLSSLTVNGTTFFNSSVSSLGYTSFASTLSVNRDFFSRSSIEFSSILLANNDVSVIGFVNVPVNTRPVRLSDGLDVPTLEVQASTLQSTDIAGSFFVSQIFSTLSSVFVGGDFTAHSLTVSGNLSTLSTISINDNIQITNESLFQANLTVEKSLGLRNSLLVQEELSVQDDLRVNQNLYVQDSLFGFSTLSTSYLGAEYGTIFGNLHIASTPVVSVQSLDIRGSLGFGNMIAVSTSVGGTVSTTSNLTLFNGTYVENSFFNAGTLSTINSFSTLVDLYLLGSMSVGRGLVLSGGIVVEGNTTVLRNSFLNTNYSDLTISTTFQQDLSIVSSIFVQDTAILSSIVLPSSVFAFNFITSTFQTGYRGITKDVQISTLITSSFTTGGIAFAEKTMDMANVFETQSLSTFLLSSLTLQVGATSQPSTFIEYTSSLGVQTIASTNTMDVFTLAYTLSNTYVNKTVSAQTAYVTNIESLSYVGDGFLLSNVNYPARIRGSTLSTGVLIIEKSFVSSFFASSGTVVDSYVNFSTLQVGQFYMYGNANQDELLGSNTLRAFQTDPTLLALNNMYIYGDAASQVTKQVVIGSEILPTVSNIYALGVKGTLRMNDLLSPGFVPFIQTFTGDIVVGVNVGSDTTNTMYISSGVLGKDGMTFFVGEELQPFQWSTNTIQPYLSTLVFNSTMFVNNETSKVGINTLPFFTLDVAPQASVDKGILVTQSTMIQGLLNINQQTSNLWIATGSCNVLLYSTDNGESWDYFTPPNPFGSDCYNIAYNGGPLGITSSNTLIAKKQWVVTGYAYISSYDEDTNTWTLGTTGSKFPEFNLGIAYNGLIWVATGYSTSNLSPSIAPTIRWSENGITWNNATSGGFFHDGITFTYGGTSVAWNGSLWVAVGQGDSLNNSILYSGDGKNWSNAQTGGFLNGGWGVVWSGSNWIASGDNGGPLSSFCVSSDGSNWTGIGGYGFNGTFFQSGYSLATDGTKVVAVGTYSPGCNSVQYSQDGGYTWNQASGSVFDRDFNTVTWNGSYWLAGSLTGVIKSLDGVNWYAPSGSLTGESFGGLAYSSNTQPILQIGESNYVSSITSTINTMNVACGIDVGVSFDFNCLRYSADGINWSKAESGFFTQEGRAAAHNGTDLWVAAGKGTANFIYSRNAKNWSNGSILSVISAFAGGTSVAYGAGYWIGTLDSGGGGGNTIFYSSDGSNWYAADLGSQFTNATLGVAYGNGKYTAVGDGTYTILYAATLSPPDTWSDFNMTNAFDTRGNGIAYGANRWIACGEDTGGYTIKYSGDQSNWTNGAGVFPTAGYGVDYDGTSRWVAVGNGAGMSPTSNILYSDDNGSNWNNISSGDFTTKGYGVRYNQALGIWMAAGEDTGGKTLKYSGDGTNWSDATGVFDTNGFGIGATSNVVSTTSTYINQLRFFNTPAPSVTLRETTPNISYTSTSLTLMDTLTIDRFKNVNIQTTRNNLLSTLYDSSVAMVSSFVSTQVTQVAAYLLTTALV